MHRFLSILLAAALVLSPAAAAPAGGGTDWEDMVYTHYDPACFYDQVQRLTDLGAAGDVQGALALYDTLYAELVHIDTLSSLAYIHYSADVTDPYWSGEIVYCQQTTVQAADTLKSACHGLLDGPCADAFAGHVGPRAAEVFAAYVPMTSREAELAAREAELVDAYYAQMNGADSLTYPYMGQTWDLETIGGVPGLSLAYQDYQGYLQVYYGLQKQLNDLVGPIYTELVQLRAEQARIQGYASYADLAYDRVYGRDYTGEQTQLLCDAAKAVGRAYTGAVLPDEDVCPVMDAAELLDTLGVYAVRVDPALEEPWQAMMEHGLCCLSAEEDRLPSSYTTYLGDYASPYIFAGLSGTSADLGTLSHEFGHFVNGWRRPAADLLTGVGSFDLLEIHSTGLEALFTEFYGDIYASGADTARAQALAGLLNSVLDGCVQDEFQRRVYAQPDMTLDEMNRLYADIRVQYGGYEPTGVDYGWMYIHHNFESPLYYISYAASALAAIQIWDLAQEDFSAGVAAWEAVLDHDAYTESYLAVLPECGLRLFTEPGAVEEVCRPLLEELDRLAAGA